MNSSTLETRLTNDTKFLGAWRALLKTGTVKALISSSVAFGIIAGSSTAMSELLNNAGSALAASDSATVAISNNSNAIKTVVTNPTYLNYWNSVPSNKARLAARVNASGSKLKRQIWTTSGTWTAPGTPIVALSVFCLGPGGNGATGSWSPTASCGGGGGGGESATKSATTSLPTSNQTVTVGSPGSSSSFGSFLSAASGANGTYNTGAQAAGGGSDSGVIYDSDPLNAIWQSNTASLQGGYGAHGSFGGSNLNGLPGEAGLGPSSVGGIAGTTNGISCTSAGAGIGYGSGGGSGAGIYPSGASAAHGNAAASNSGSGGGGGSGTSTIAVGGSGGTGLVIAWWIEG